MACVTNLLSQSILEISPFWIHSSVETPIFSDRFLTFPLFAAPCWSGWLPHVTENFVICLSGVISLIFLNIFVCIVWWTWALLYRRCEYCFCVVLHLLYLVLVTNIILVMFFWVSQTHYLTHAFCYAPLYRAQFSHSNEAFCMEECFNLINGHYLYA